jgi:hypothetical protein
MHTSASRQPLALGGNMQPNKAPVDSPTTLGNDILEGADNIAAFLFGSKDLRRKVYYLSERCKLPIFRFGSMLCARKSTLMEFIVGQEIEYLLGEPEEGETQDIERPLAISEQSDCRDIGYSSEKPQESGC